MPKVSSRLLSVALFLLVLAFASPGVKAAQVNKCIINGAVSYQQDPCPSGQARKQPSLEELNAAEKKKRAVAAAAAAAAAADSASSPATAGRRLAAPPVAPSPAAAMTPALASPTFPTGFRCDGRQHCRQMKSCEEAKYFLRNCPGVKMDGDRDGFPCELDVCRNELPGAAR
ncbi:MAG: calcium-binding protein [Methylibium sp.]|nr:calcium-binding protein [Methylibium sp.]